MSSPKLVAVWLGWRGWLAGCWAAGWLVAGVDWVKPWMSDADALSYVLQLYFEIYWYTAELPNSGTAAATSVARCTCRYLLVSNYMTYLPRVVLIGGTVRTSRSY